MKVLKEGDRHLTKTIKVGTGECPKCGSELEVLEEDFKPIGDLRTVELYASCPICDCRLGMGRFGWTLRKVPV